MPDSTGSVAALLEHFAEADPAELDRWQVLTQREADDPDRQDVWQVEARRRLLERIDEVRRLVQV